MDSHLHRSGRNGAPRTAHFSVEKVEANVEIDDSMFEYPDRVLGGEIIAGPGAKPPSFEAQRTAAPASVSFDEGVISGLGAPNIAAATMSGRVSAVAGLRVVWDRSSSGGGLYGMADVVDDRPHGRRSRIEFLANDMHRVCASAGVDEFG
jgi:hypothetical protein